MQIYHCIIPHDSARFPQDYAYLYLFTVPYYEPAIDRMSYGVVVYNRMLRPDEVAGSGLVCEPRE